MHMLIDMASSPQYLASSAQNPDHIDIDPRITTMADGSCAGIAPSTVAYSNSDHTSYSEVRNCDFLAPRCRYPPHRACLPLYNTSSRGKYKRREVGPGMGGWMGWDGIQQDDP